MTMHQHTALLTENVLHTNDLCNGGVACYASFYVSHWYNGLLHEKQGITASKCCVTVLVLSKNRIIFNI